MELIISQVTLFEIANTPDGSRRRELELLVESAHRVIIPDMQIAQRAAHFESFGLQAFDALHLACAENHAEVLLTVDDSFRKKSNQISDRNIAVCNPLSWLSEVLESE